jgi:L-fuconolactonase
MSVARAHSRRNWLHRAGCAAAATLVPARVSSAVDEAPPCPILDAHTHFYDPGRPEGVPWPAKGDPVLDRTVLPEEWERTAAPFGVIGTVVVEASPWIEDNQWLLDLADRHRPGPGRLGIVGVVGQLPLGEPACAALVERFRRHRLFRGLRAWPDALGERLDAPAVRADLERLASAGLALDLAGSTALRAADRIARATPGLRIIVDHLGSPPIKVEDGGPSDDWRDSLAAAAGHPRVFLKVSGLLEAATQAAHDGRPPLAPEHYQPWLDAAWNTFGDGRLLFGSNWPVSDLAGSYGDVLRIVQPYFRRHGPEAERRFFADTCRAAYQTVERR